ncbi:DUF3419 family protein [Arsenicibacter rosenii]|uniref:S-adenosylmethionine--diacylglycerol 3-amino-3-carboxypropyl transferase n=1 Tax=Arsenicibacter rosenii TaxID=1750698 RepID=A0A1S2VD55_9BACT|nr:DUF3419 family protein [Arsenicibacter rosenii]OIN56622.1 hypothetical protein BLX24_23615 [Arsenicibacter rosenii]
MQSEFYSVDLDRIRYSLVWEDSQTLYHSLDIRPEDRVLVITSAGCNVLNTLLKNPRQVIAIDLNPVQNALLALKIHVIQQHDQATLRGMLGLDGPQAVARAAQQLAVSLPVAQRAYWASFFASHPDGILTAGKLEAYITRFRTTCPEPLRERIRHLFTFDDLPAQRRFFEQELDNGPFQEAFIHYFDDANLSQGRDPRLFRYAQESGGRAFYRRLSSHLSTVLVKDNFFTRFFFLGPLDLPEAILPPCYQAQHMDTLRERLSRISAVDGEAISYLLSPAGQAITKASLSNIFEYTSEPEFHRVCEALLTDPQRPLRFVYWNLLQGQGDSAVPATGFRYPFPGGQTRQTACFYFKNQYILATHPFCLIP